MRTQEVVQQNLLAEQYTEVFLPDSQIQVLTLTPCLLGYNAIVIDLSQNAATTLVLFNDTPLQVNS